MRRPLVVPMVVLLACGAAACGSADEATPTAPSTTSPSTTSSVAVTTTATVATTTSALPDTTIDPDGPACVEQAPGADVENDALFADFGPLGTAPSLAVDIPYWSDQFGQSAERTFTALRQVPGGVLIAVSSADRSVAAVVDLDGSVRWRRCFASTLEIYAPPEPAGVDRVLTVTRDPADTVEVAMLDLADGVSHQSPELDSMWQSDEVLYLNVGIVGDTFVLRPWAMDYSTPLDAALATVDLRTFEVGSLPAPPREGDGITELSDGRVAWTAPGAPGFTTVVAVLVGGQWAEPGDLAGVWDPRVYRWQADGAQSAMPVAYGADGTQWWVRADLNVPRGEITSARVFGEVMVTSVCLDALCSNASLVGLDLRTGSSLWEQPDYAYSVVSADGFVLVNGSNGAAIIQADTGEVVPGQMFPEGWPLGCCADPSTTVISGGVLFAAGETLVRVYLPKMASTPLVQVGIFD